MKDIFKSWVPEWLIKISLFSGLMPSMILFFLPGANIHVTAGFYGCQPSDVQLLIVLFYAGFVSFYVLERRFFEFLPVKPYYIIFNLLQIINCLLMYYIRDIEWVYGLRFFQGMLFASAVNLSISMIFSRLKTDRAKEGSYAVFFGMLLCSSPFNTFVTADFIDSFNFDEIYFYAALAFIPGLVMIILFMNPVFKIKPYPLRSLDWPSFVLFGGIILCLGYMMVYGQEVYWFSNSVMFNLLLCGIIMVVLFCVRQYTLKRAYIHLPIFRSKNFLLGLLVLFTMYIERFSLSIANQYFVQILNLDPINLSYIQWFNILGIVVGVLSSLYWLLEKMAINKLWLVGFGSLLLFHGFMFFSFEHNGNDYYFYIPLIVHGFGVGLIMVPTILFVISSVSSGFGVSAAAICLGVRYLGFISNIGLQNYLSLFYKNNHQQAFADQLSSNNIILNNYLKTQSIHFFQSGLAHKQQSAALKLISQRVQHESFVRFAMDYYELMCLASVAVIFIVILTPSLKNMYQKLRNNTISPA